MMNSVNYNAGAFVTLVGVCLLLNSGGAAYLLAQANLERWKKTVFVVAALASLALKITLATRGHNYDMDSWGIAASLVLQGKSVYANTTRITTGQVWPLTVAGLKQLSTLLPAMGGEAFHVAVGAFLGITDVALAAALSTKYRFGAGVFFLCCPATILLTGYHSQFENYALLAGLVAWLLIRNGSASTRRVVLAAGLQGLSLAIKHILFLFPLWVLFWTPLGSWRKRLAYVAIAYGIFGLSFLPWIFDPLARAGIYHNVFQYRSVFILSLSWLLVSMRPFALVSPMTSTLLTLVWIAAVITIGIVAGRQKRDLFPAYLLAVFAFSPAVVDQYLAVPLLACAILYPSWPAWALAGTATLALVSSPAEIFGFSFNLVFYAAMVSTQICALALLLIQMRPASAARTFPLSKKEAAQKALTLSFGSIALVLVILLVKSFLLH